MWNNWTEISIIYGSSALAILWALINTMSITSIVVDENYPNEEEEKQKLNEK